MTSHRKIFVMSHMGVEKAGDNATRVTPRRSSMISKLSFGLRTYATGQSLCAVSRPLSQWS